VTIDGLAHRAAQRLDGELAVDDDEALRPVRRPVIPLGQGPEALLLRRETKPVERALGGARLN
jgi:hypothetical protein